MEQSLNMDASDARGFIESITAELKSLRVKCRTLEAEKLADRDLIASLKAQAKEHKKENLLLKDDLVRYNAEMKRGNYIISQISKSYDELMVREKVYEEKLSAFERINTELRENYNNDVGKVQGDFLNTREKCASLELENIKLTGYICHLEREILTLSSSNHSFALKNESISLEHDEVTDILRSVQKFIIYAVTFCKSQSQSSYKTLNETVLRLEAHYANLNLYGDTLSPGGLDGGLHMGGVEGMSSLQNSNNSRQGKYMGGGSPLLNKSNLKSRTKIKIYKQFYDLFSYLRELTKELYDSNDKLLQLKTRNASLKDVIHTYDAAWSIIDDNSNSK